MYGQYTRELGEYARETASKASKKRKTVTDDVPEGFQTYSLTTGQKYKRITSMYTYITQLVK